MRDARAAAPSAACLVIGDEILSGKVHDRNSHLLAQVLFERGVRLLRVETVPDALDDIAEGVRRLSARHTYVFTSGGIGPTHDDMTYEGVARAFGVGLAYHEATLRRFEAHRQRAGRGPLNEARKRMALLPVGCEVWEDADLWVPWVVMGNVHVLPGVPELFERMLLAQSHRFVGAPLYRIELFTDAHEGDIAEGLSACQAAHPEVAIGSYPQSGGAAGYAVKVTLETLRREDAEAVALRLLKQLPFRREPSPAVTTGAPGASR